MHREPTDDDLMAAIGDHADEAVALLTSRYGSRITHFVQGLVRDVHVAQDVTQEVFEKVFTKRDLYRPGTNFKAWLFEIARNQALSALRSRRRSPRPVSSFPALEGGDLLERVVEAPNGVDLEERELMAALVEAVHELPERYRTVFELCVQQGHSYQDAARRLGVPTGTVAIRIMRARRRLFQALSHHIGRLRRPPACFQ